MQPSLPLVNLCAAFDGPDLTPEDQVRLSRHLLKVATLMADQRWRSLQEIADGVGCSEASASARLRDLRQRKHGAFTVNRTRISAGLWHYQVLP